MGLARPVRRVNLSVEIAQSRVCANDTLTICSMSSRGSESPYPLATTAIVVVSKFPAPGKVKTRLTGEITAECAAGVHRAFLLHVCRRLVALAPAELIVLFDPPESRDAMVQLLDGVGAMRFEGQVNGDLGQRIAHGLAIATTEYPHAMLLAVDSPDVPSSHLLNCASALTDADTVLGLSEDGGYWCIGARAGVEFAKWLHSDIEWSTERTAEQTLAAAQRLGYSTHASQMWDDVDRPDDLRRLLRRLAANEGTLDARLLDELRAVLPATFLKGCA